MALPLDLPQHSPFLILYYPDLGSNRRVPFRFDTSSFDCKTTVKMAHKTLKGLTRGHTRFPKIREQSTSHWKSGLWVGQLTLGQIIYFWPSVCSLSKEGFGPHTNT